MNILRCNKIVISLDCKCVVLTRVSTTIGASLVSNQEEADTKVILHCHHILNESTDSIITLRSPSGDTDIIVIAVSLVKDFGDSTTRQRQWKAVESRGQLSELVTLI